MPLATKNADLGLRAITGSPEREWQPAVSPDGTFVVYAEGLPEQPEDALAISPRDGPLGTSLGTLGFESVETPTFMPDGLALLVTAQRSNGDWDVFKVPLNPASGIAEEPVPLIYTPDRSERRAALSPDGRYVAFDAEVAGNTDIYIRDLVTEEDRRLTYHPAADRLPTFSPDGFSLLYRTERDGNSEIYRAGWDGSWVNRLTEDLALDTYASFSPDGEHIVFQSNRGGTEGVFLMDPDGANIQRLTSPDRSFVTPRFGPDGRYVVMAGMDVSGEDRNEDVYVLFLP